MAVSWIAAASAQDTGDQAAAVAAANPLRDMLGIWVNPHGAHNERPPEDPRLQLPAVVPPKLTPEYAARTAAIEASWVQADETGVVGTSADDFTIRRQIMCIPYGLPRTMTRNMSLDILDGGDHITIVGELDREIRRIWMDREQISLDEINPGYWGRSVGRWDGDTLVIHTTGVKEEIFGEEWMAHSEQMVIEERIFLKDKDFLYNEITINDPEALLEPFRTYAVYIRADSSFEPSEFVCDELPIHKIGADGLLTIDTESVE